MVVITEEMKSNYFYQNRMKIKALGDQNYNSDYTIASLMFWTKVDPKHTEHREEKVEWDSLMVKFQKDKDQNLTDLFK